MIYADLLRDQSLLIIKPVGTLHQSDFERLSLLVDPYLAEEGELHGLMILIKSFPHWDSFQTLLTHMRFANDRHKRIEKIAVVTDDFVLSMMPGVIRHFMHADVRRFHYADKEQAYAWLRETADDSMCDAMQAALE